MQMRSVLRGFRIGSPVRVAVICWVLCTPVTTVAAEGPGEFDRSTDVGRVEVRGAVEFDAARGRYRVTGSGANIWGNADAFQFVSKTVSGDLELSTEVHWQGAGKNAHRKAGWMVRQDLEADSPYADAVVHGDGLISLQFRRERAGPTLEVKTPFKPPATIRLERNADLFTISVAPQGQGFRPAGSVTVALPGKVYAGLAVCSHEAEVSETAIFGDVRLKSEPEAAAGPARVRESTLETVAIDGGLRTIVYRAKAQFESAELVPRRADVFLQSRRDDLHASS